MKSADMINVEGDGKVMWGASLSGPLDAPGYYNIELLYGDSIKMSTGCFIMPDPRFSDQYLENYASKKQLLDSVIA